MFSVVSSASFFLKLNISCCIFPWQLLTCIWLPTLLFRTIMVFSIFHSPVLVKMFFSLLSHFDDYVCLCTFLTTSEYNLVFSRECYRGFVMPNYNDFESDLSVHFVYVVLISLSLFHWKKSTNVFVIHGNVISQHWELFCVVCNLEGFSKRQHRKKCSAKKKQLRNPIAIWDIF